MFRPGFLGVALLAAGCAEWTQAPNRSVGRPQSGFLVGGRAMPDSGPGYVRARPGESTRFAVDRLVGAIERAAARVAALHPDGAPLRVGDFGAPGGGRHPRHHSHRSGRDVDLVFYQTDPAGRSRPPRTAAFDRQGRAREAPEVRFDTARNWALVEALLSDRTIDVQWIFCSHGVKAVLLAYAAEHSTDPDALVRASAILHQPSDGRPHDDHFHVRVYCSAEEATLGCLDAPPHWTFVPRERAPVAPREDDAAILEALAGPVRDDE